MFNDTDTDTDETEGERGDGTALFELGAFVGPAGWLAEFSPGDLVAFTRRGALIEVAPAGAHVADGAPEAARLRERYDAIAEGAAEAVEIDIVVLDALIHDVDLWATPTRPIGDVLGDAGLDFDRGFIGPSDRPWEVPDASTRLLRLMLATEFGFSVCCHDAFDIAVDAFDTFDHPTMAEGIDWQAVGKALVHSDVARALVALASPVEGRPAARVADFATRLASRDQHSRAAGAFITALVLDESGEAETAATVLEAAVEADPRFGPAAEEHARVLADQGELDRAIDVRQRLGFARDPELEYLLSLRAPRRATAGRNDPCPCGSGKKFKRCCLDKPASMATTTRASWLQHKLVGFAYDRRHRPVVVELCEHAARSQADPATTAEVAREVFDTGIAATWLLFDGGLAERFLEKRGVLLPPIEREMLTDWVTRPASMFEILTCDWGVALTLCASRSGDAYVVHDVRASKEHQPGESVLAHIGLVDGHFEFIGIPMTIEARHRGDTDDLVASEPDAFDMADWFAGITAPGPTP